VYLMGRWDFLWSCGVAKRVAFHFKEEFKDYSLIRVVYRLISFDQGRLIYIWSCLILN
jgi:hypothetical protein